MSGLEAETGLEILEDLKALFSEEAPCEGAGHGEHRAHPHPEEPGEWYMHSHCPHCGVDRVRLVCNTMKESCTGRALLFCLSCSRTSFASEIIRKTTRRGTEK